jgi:D-alanyl-D-alanine dipeptidase
MLDLTSPIPTISFPEHKTSVGSPKQEKMIILNNYFHCDSQYFHWKEDNNKPIPGSSPYIAARESVVNMLLSAEKLLPKGYHFLIYDAYRPIAVQQYLWDFYYNKTAEENPEKSDDEIIKMTKFFVSYPSYNVLQPSLHNTGGAVDLTILDKNDHELNMGCNFDDFSHLAWTNHFELPEEDNEEVLYNRRMLYNVMISVGFTNLPSEWWHYDYGDDKYAQLTQTEPFYTGILDAGIRDTVSYEKQKEIQNIDALQQKAVANIIQARKQCEFISKQ